VDTVDAFYEEIGGGLFEDDAASAEAHGADNVAIVFCGGEDNDACGQLIEIDFFQDGETVFIGHAEIEEQDIGLEFGEELDALGAVLGFANDGHFVVGVEKFAEAVAENRVVVREEDSYLLFSFGHVLSSG
jgi:hypothetical protein